MSKNIVIVDTSVLIKRPSIINDLLISFDEVIIPEVVISELNNLKDRAYSVSIQQQAWLVMKSISDLKNKLSIENNCTSIGKNDEKIVAIGIQKAKNMPSASIYILSDDIWFSLLIQIQKSQTNIYSLTPNKYIERFLCSSTYDTQKTLQFIYYVKDKDLNSIKKFDISNIDINLLDPNSGLHILSIAVRNKDISMIEYLLSLKNINLDIQDSYKYGFTAVHHATQLKNFKIIQLLIKAGADCDCSSIGKNAGNTPLMVAAWSNFYEAVDYFLHLGACANQQDNNGYTPLIKACIKHNIKIIKRLIPVTDLNIRSRENKKAIEYLNLNKDTINEILPLFKENYNDR